MVAQPGDWRRLLEAGAVLTAYLDLEEVLRGALPLAAEAAGAESASVILHDAGSRELVIAAVSGPHAERIRGLRFPESAGIAGEVLAAGQPRIVADAQRESSHLKDVDQVSGCVTRSLMAAPLALGRRTLGVVEAVNRSGGGAFQAEELERFTAFCGLIAVAIENAGLYRRLDHETEALRRSREDDASPLVAESAPMRQALVQADRAAQGRSTVLLIGETGTGKEQVARRIHERSPRAERPFVALNCGALPEGLLESELFGHEKGAFTGADRRRLGRFELADGGTLFLDEIGELPASAQVKLLRVLQEHEFHRVGGNDSIRVDVRLVAATHRDLEDDVRGGRFREDLFFRVNVVPVRLPPLRERPEDIAPLAELFLDRFGRELGRPPRPLSPEALERLRAYRWPGNVRELENLMERLLVLGDEGPIRAEELPQASTEAAPHAAGPPASGGELSLWDRERALLTEALERASGNQSQAARLMKISREQLRTRMKRYGLLPHLR